MVTPNNIDFTDNHNNSIHLTRERDGLNHIRPYISENEPVPYINNESEAYKPTNITNKSAFESGYQHGVNDPDFKYLQSGKGFGHHTPDFIKGYVAGWCSLPGNYGTYAGSDSDQGTFDCILGPEIPTR